MPCLSYEYSEGGHMHPALTSVSWKQVELCVVSDTLYASLVLHTCPSTVLGFNTALKMYLVSVGKDGMLGTLALLADVSLAVCLSHNQGKSVH